MGVIGTNSESICPISALSRLWLKRFWKRTVAGSLAAGTPTRCLSFEGTRKIVDFRDVLVVPKSMSALGHVWTAPGWQELSSRCNAVR